MSNIRLLMGCRPADVPATMPQFAEEFALHPLESGWISKQCELCGIEVQMGPRQRSLFELAPEDFLVACLVCGKLKAAAINGPLPTEFMGLGGQ